VKTLNLLAFYDPDFPGALEIDVEKLHDLGFVVSKADDLPAKMCRGDVLLNLHGSYFPEDAFPGLMKFLESGGGLVNFGPPPFQYVCRHAPEGWKVGRKHIFSLRELHLHDAIQTDGELSGKVSCDRRFKLLKGYEQLFRPRKTWHFIMDTTKANLGSDIGDHGPIDALIYPLLQIESDGAPIASPIVFIEHRSGKFSGGRWIFANLEHEDIDSRGIEELLLRLSVFAAKGARDLWCTPNYASFEPGERPGLRFQAEDLKTCAEWKFKYSVIFEGQEMETGEVALPAREGQRIKNVMLSHDYNTGGFYKVRIQAQSSDGEHQVLEQGFVVKDRDVLQKGDFLTCGRDYFIKDGKNMPVVGMTYMAGDFSRYFLFLPNVSVWMDDFARMKQLGVNMIRTGVWTGWRQIMYVDGHFREEVLRALDAFIYLGALFDIEIVFTFFAFTPPLFEGVNPYLDPRSVAAQKRFIAAVAERYKDVKRVHYDLINEPSVFDPKRAFQGPRTCGDEYERQSFAAWLEKKYGTIEALWEVWEMPANLLSGFSDVRPPEPWEINYSPIFDSYKNFNGLKAVDYADFCSDAFNHWAREMKKVINSIQPAQMVTVGQDEGNTSQRPTGFHYGNVTDYTSTHSWWMLDDLLYDTVFAKHPYKSVLVQETGIMHQEQPDGYSKRTETEMMELLERKYGYAFAGAGAGAIHWVWNVNYFMNSTNESSIGAKRADGSEKPEIKVTENFGKFMAVAGPLMEDRQLDKIAVVFPFSNDGSNRRCSLRSTTKAARALAYYNRFPFYALSEYHLDVLPDLRPDLVIVPSPYIFDDDAFENLLNYVSDSGCTVLWTGPLVYGKHYEFSSRGEEMFGKINQTSLSRIEFVNINGKEYVVPFDVETRAGIMLNSAGWSEKIHVADCGKGKFIWSELPLELGENMEALAAAYETAAGIAGIGREIKLLSGDTAGVYCRVMRFRDNDLYILVSEMSKDRNILFEDLLRKHRFEIMLESNRVAMFMTDVSGTVIASYRDNPVKVARMGG